MRKARKFVVGASSLVVMLSPAVALAYIGPGIGAGAIAVIVGVISAILLALGSILYFPIKRMIKRKKAQRSQASEEKSDLANNVAAAEPEKLKE